MGKSALYHNEIGHLTSFFDVSRGRSGYCRDSKLTAVSRKFGTRFHANDFLSSRGGPLQSSVALVRLTQIPSRRRWYLSGVSAEVARAVSAHSVHRLRLRLEGIKAGRDRPGSSECSEASFVRCHSETHVYGQSGVKRSILWTDF
jgi:hypothetical protein